MKLCLPTRLCTKCLYTSIWGISMDKSMCSYSYFSRRGCTPDACIQTSGGFSWTVLCVHKVVSPDTVVHQTFVYKRLGDFRCVFLCVHAVVSQDTVVHHMLVYKCRASHTSYLVRCTMYLYKSKGTIWDVQVRCTSYIVPTCTWYKVAARVAATLYDCARVE